MMSIPSTIDDITQAITKQDGWGHVSVDLTPSLVKKLGKFIPGKLDDYFGYGMTTLGELDDIVSATTGKDLFEILGIEGGNRKLRDKKISNIDERTDHPINKNKYVQDKPIKYKK